ncbi:MAG: hypothetical protein Q8927_09155 [Bacteroidota bacterium]|nr:hypothetical protein [Bacteroidota bacterium]MDP4247598.1 hypothetical protein [Bacteroidota bacterium]MDP4257468.1 hypothetical protein [Bacteroidota bacterium]
MNKYGHIIIRSGLFFFGVTLIGIGVLQVVFADFESVILPYWPDRFPGKLIGVYIASLGLIIPGMVLLLGKDLRKLCLWLGVAFLLLFLIGHLPYRLVHDLHSMGPWTNSLKTLTFSGGALLLAKALPGKGPGLVEKVVPAAPLFIAIFLIFCGIEHFVYAPFVATLVPAWIPGAMFWTYFAGAALIAAGLGILLPMTRRLAAALLGAMIFLWLLMLHIPRAVADPIGLNGNECVSVFEALSFSGFAFVLAVISGRDGRGRGDSRQAADGRL